MLPLLLGAGIEAVCCVLCPIEPKMLVVDGCDNDWPKTFVAAELMPLLGLSPCLSSDAGVGLNPPKPENEVFVGAGCVADPADPAALFIPKPAKGLAVTGAGDCAI
jgi:hypothetical protein